MDENSRKFLQFFVGARVPQNFNKIKNISMCIISSFKTVYSRPPNIRHLPI